MTILQPSHRNPFLSYLIGALIVLVAGASFWVVSQYASMVDMEHEIVRLQEERDVLEADGAALRDKMFALLDGTAFESVANERGLVRDRDPRYVTIEHAWSLVSRY